MSEQPNCFSLPICGQKTLLFACPFYRLDSRAGKQLHKNNLHQLSVFTFWSTLRPLPWRPCKETPISLNIVFFFVQRKLTRDVKYIFWVPILIYVIFSCVLQMSCTPFGNISRAILNPYKGGKYFPAWFCWCEMDGIVFLGHCLLAFIIQVVFFFFLWVYL